MAQFNRARHNRWAITVVSLVVKDHGDHFARAFSYQWTAIKGWRHLMKLARLLNVLTFWMDVGRTLLRTRGYQDAIRCSSV